MGLACEQAFSRAAWGEGKAKRPVDRPLGPPFHGTRCASDPDASSYWREHWLLTGLIDIGFNFRSARSTRFDHRVAITKQSKDYYHGEELRALVKRLKLSLKKH